MSLTPQQIAERSAAVMWEADHSSAEVGLTLDHVGPGTAVTSMTVEQRHLNGHQMCHGGFIFTLADTAFAFACNSYNQNTVAQHNAITYLRPGPLGERLIATASEVTKAGRSGIYDVVVRTEAGVEIAQFRGHSRAIKGTLFNEDET